MLNFIIWQVTWGKQTSGSNLVSQAKKLWRLAKTTTPASQRDPSQEYMAVCRQSVGWALTFLFIITESKSSDSKCHLAQPHQT